MRSVVLRSINAFDAFCFGNGIIQRQTAVILGGKQRSLHRGIDGAKRYNKRREKRISSGG